MSLTIPPATGFFAPGFEKVFATFSDSFTKGIDKGASFAAYYRGKPVVKIWGGLADVSSKRPWKEDTMGFFHSTTKFITSVVIAHMVERGLLHYSDKVRKYWPEFAQNGKENITLEMILSHKAGIPMLSENYSVRWLLDDPDRLHDLLVKQKPYWSPGEAHGYHSMTFGLYLNEIVKRSDRKKRTLSQYYQEEIAGPFGIDFYIGLPKHLQHRAARLEHVRVPREILTQQMQNFKGDPELFQLNLTQPQDWNAVSRLNDPDFMEIPTPSSHGVGTAQAVAKFCSILACGGEHDGKVLLSPESIAKLQEPLSYGTDRTLSGSDTFGRGSWLIPVVEGDKTWFMFGHSGYGDQCAAADPHYQAGWAYTTNFIDKSISFTGNNKWRPLEAALFDCIHRLENVRIERRLLHSYDELDNLRQSRRIKSYL